MTGRIPYDPVMTDAKVHGQPVTAYANHGVGDLMKVIWNGVKQRLLTPEPLVV